MNNDLDAVYFCYKHPYATYKTLESFKKFHPNSKVYLISDNGYDYTKMAKHFDCAYIHSTQKCNGNMESYGSMSSYDSYLVFDKFCQMYEYVFKMSDKKYIIKLEDDNIIQGIIDTSKFKSTIIGRIFHNIPSSFLDIWYDYHKTYNKPDKMYFTGHGGSLFNREDLLKCLSNKEILEQVKNVYISCNILNNYLIDDVVFSILIQVCGYNIENNPTQLEVDTEKHKNRNDYIILHQVKENYNKPLPDELKHLVDYN